MQYSAALLTLLPLAMATTIRVNVGKDGLSFTPDKVEALPGDILEFHYYPKNHSVQQSNFAQPCQPLANGVNSGFVPVPNNTVIDSIQRFNVQVNDTKPIWFYCAQGAHCSSGMSMVVNEPKNKNTLAAYKEAAKQAKTGVNSVAPIGGNFSSSDLPTTSATTHAPWTTYTESYSTYTTSTNGAATTVTLVQTVTALPGQTSSASTSSSASTTSSTGAAPTLAAAGWAVAAGAVAIGGMLI